MKCAFGKVGMAIVLAGGLSVAAAAAQEKALPTLLIKGEVVSFDASDPSASLLKVKDRYGFETPIFITTETKILQGEAAASAASLTAGTPVEVEYNFDVNTAKRHAVSVKVAAAPAPAAPAAEAPAAPLAEPAAPAAEAPGAESAAPASSAPANASAPAKAAPAPTGEQAPSSLQ